MLTELSIQDFAIIDKVSITFNEGLTVLTGETGAGKSIIIDAVQLLAGGRGSVEYVRHESKKAEIEGLFSLKDQHHPVYNIGHTYGIEIQDDMIVLHRTITASGKSICRVNGKLVTLAILREFGKTLIDIHTQHETQSLMDSENHIQLLDLFDQRILESKKEYTALYDKYVALQKRYNKLNDNEQEMNHRLDLLEFQIKELDETKLTPNEDDDLEEERRQLTNYERIYLGVQNAYSALYGEQKGVEWLNQAQLALQDNKAYDTFISEKAEQLTNFYYMVEEISFELRDYRDQLHYDEGRLNEIEARLNDINRLKKKYGATVNDMLEYMVKIEEEIDQIKNKDSHLHELSEQIDDIRKDVFLEAKQLHDMRKSAAESLIKAIRHELNDLYLENAQFSIAFNPDEVHTDAHDQSDSERLYKLHKNGLDHIHFLISTNTGEPLKELSKVASGGELSRVMLTLKKIFAKHQGVTSVIFDEVDTGVSGRVAQSMGEKIYHISNDSQVLCITHLPQVAAMADTHIRIDKIDQDERTQTTVTELTKSEQIKELSRMMTGAKLTETALEHGKKLLDLASTFKQNTHKETEKA